VISATTVVFFFSIWMRVFETLFFYERATVIGDGLSVTRFFIDPFEKLAPANWNAVSVSF
jgi:hypothetical protein